VISVAATTSTDARASFSNYGATTVDLGAPGANVLSSVRNSGFSYFNGTSMATPHVAGAAALILAVNGTLSAGAVKSTLLTTTDPISSLFGITVTGGRLNLYRAVNSVTPPAADFTMGATPPSQSVAQNTDATFTVSVSPLNGFTGNVDLSVSGLPANATAGFASPTISGGSGSTSLQVSTTGVAAGTYTLTVTGTSGTMVRSTSVVLTVVAPDFTLEASPSSQSVRRGTNGDFTITVSALNGFSEDVKLSVVGLPSGFTATWVPSNSIVGSGVATLRIMPGKGAPRGVTQVTVEGTTASQTHSAAISITVTK
jgi:hypothetical protein